MPQFVGATVPEVSPFVKTLVMKHIDTYYANGVPTSLAESIEHLETLRNNIDGSLEALIDILRKDLQPEN